MAGRELELELLMAALGDALLLNGSLYIVSGEAGIGKTRLIEEFEARARMVGCVSLIGRCIPGRPSPYLPFVEVIGQYLDNGSSHSVNNSQEKRALMVNIFDSFSDNSEKASGEASSKQMLSSHTLFALLDFFKTAAKEQPLIVRIEDLHWADSSSIQMLHYMARNIKGLRILLVGTYRPEDLWPDQLGNIHPLKDVLRIMKKEGICEEIVLRGLNDSEMRCLFPILLNGQLEPSLLRRLIVECEGNPLYAIEMARLLNSENALELRDGMWMGTSKAFGIPRVILEVIQSRLEKVPKESKHVLEWASVIGLRFQPRTIAQAMSLGMMDLFEVLEALESEYLVVSQENGVCQFAHDKVRQAVYDSIAPSKREELHRVIGGILEDQKGVTVGTLADHFFRAKDDLRCIKYSLLAGEEFARKGAFPDAQPFFEQVLVMNDGSTSTLPMIARANEGLGDVNLELGKLEEASAYFKTAMEMSLDPEVKTRTKSKLHVCDEFRDALDKEKYFQSAIARYEALGEDENVILCLAYLTDVQLTIGRVDDAIRTSERGMTLLQRCPSLLAKRVILHQAGMLNFHLGNAKEARRDLSDSIELASYFNDSMNISLGSTELSLVLDSVDDLEAAYSIARRGYEEAKGLNMDLITLNSSAGLLHACIRSEKLKEARSLYDMIIDRSKDFKWGIHSTEHCLFLASLAEMKATSGEWDMSVEDFNRSLRMMKATPNGILLEAVVRSWFAEYLKKRGHIQEAQDQLDNAIKIYMRLGNINQAHRLSIKREEVQSSRRG